MKSQDPEQNRIRNGDLEQAELDRFIDSYRTFLEEVSKVLGPTESPELALAPPEEPPTPTLD
jgi:hypothetical protein